MSLSKRWIEFKSAPLYKLWRQNQLSRHVYNDFSFADICTLVSELYCTASGGSLGPADSIADRYDKKREQLLDMLDSLKPLAAAAENGEIVFGEDTPAQAEPLPEETPEERALAADLTKHPATDREHLGEMCRDCKFFVPSGNGKGICSNAYVKQPDCELHLGADNRRLD